MKTFISDMGTEYKNSVINDLCKYLKIKTRKNAIVEYLDYQIPVTQLMGPKGN